MKKLLIIILITAACSSVSCTVCDAQQQQFRLASMAFYNLENLFDPTDDPLKADEDFTPGGANHYTEKIYHEKLHNMATVLAGLGTELCPGGPALIGVAEVENAAVLHDLVAEPALRDRAMQVVHFDSPDNRGVDVGLLYRPDCFTLLQACALPVDIMRDGKREYTRDVLYASGLLGPDTLHVFVNHWPSRRGGEAATVWKRAKAAAVCKRIIDSLVQQNPHTLYTVMGDLNDDPPDPSITETLGARGEKDKVPPGGMYNPWLAFYRKGIGTLGHNDSWSLFDQIILSYGFLRQGSQWRYYRAEVFNRDFLKNRSGKYKGYPHRSFSGTNWAHGYSDHFPTLVYLARPER